MSLVLLLLLGLALYRIKVSSRGSLFQKEYLSIPVTNSIKGFFVCCVLLNHFHGFLTFDNLVDKPFCIFIYKVLGQLIVTMFLFYSGYGIMESIKKKGNVYIRKIPIRRFLRVLFEFDVALLIYLCLKDIIGSSYSGNVIYSAKNIVLAFLAIGNIGNPAWFIFCILIQYLFVWIAFSLFKDHKNALVLMFALNLAYMISCFFILSADDGRFYNTSICFVAGMIYSFSKYSIERIVFNNYRMVLLAAFCTYGGVKALYKVFKNLLLVVNFNFDTLINIVYYPILSLCFVFLILVISLKVKVENKFLDYMGKHVFSVYMLQFIPMYILRYFGVLKYNPYLFVALAIVLTIFIAHFYSIDSVNFFL